SGAASGAGFLIRAVMLRVRAGAERTIPPKTGVPEHAIPAGKSSMRRRRRSYPRMTPVQAALAFAFAAGILTTTPGLDTALVLRTAAASGPKAAAKTALGILLGLFVWGVVTAVGIGALLRASTLAYRVLQVAGSLYLLWLGLNLLFKAGAPHAPSTVAPA